MTKVFIDTNIIKFSATKQLRFIPVNKPIRNWYGKKIGYQVSTLGYVNPNDKWTTPQQSCEVSKWIFILLTPMQSIEEFFWLKDQSEINNEAELLEDVANLAKDSHITLFEDMEMLVESMGLPNIASSSGRFFNAPIQKADPPIRYSRVIIGPSYMESPKDLALDFLKNIRDSRFKEIQKVTGAYQGDGKYNLNQLRDAFLLWSAEHNQCDYFLTLDFKLIKMISRDKGKRVKVKAVRPSELLKLFKNLTKRSTRRQKQRFWFPPFSRRWLPRR